jgi:carboxymethylenebutenolidase
MPDIMIKGPDGSFAGYLAVPEAASGPGIVLIQEIFGVNKVMRDRADDLAAAGYTVLCPDLFWRQEPGIQITDQSDEEWARAFELYKGFDEAKGVDDLAATLDHLRNHEACTGKVGSVGFCLGGKLAYLMATRTDIDCNVGYYGVGIENALDEVGNISAPLLLHIAEQDGFCPAEAQAQIHAALDGNANVTIHDYAGVDHAFARPGGDHFDADAAEAANGRTAAFFAQHLKG